MIKETEQTIIKSTGKDKKQKAKTNTTRNMIKNFVLCVFPSLLKQDSNYNQPKKKFVKIYILNIEKNSESRTKNTTN